MVWAGDPQRQVLRGIQPFHEGASGQQAAGVSPGWHVSPHSVSQNQEAPGPDAPTRQGKADPHSWRRQWAPLHRPQRGRHLLLSHCPSPEAGQVGLGLESRAPALQPVPLSPQPAEHLWSEWSVPARGQHGRAWPQLKVGVSITGLRDVRVSSAGMAQGGEHWDEQNLLEVSF